MNVLSSGLLWAKSIKHSVNTDVISPSWHTQKSSQHIRACATGDSAICSKNRKIVPYHGDSPNSRISARLRSPSPIMAPGFREMLHNHTHKVSCHPCNVLSVRDVWQFNTDKISSALVLLKWKRISLHEGARHFNISRGLIYPQHWFSPYYMSQLQVPSVCATQYFLLLQNVAEHGPATWPLVSGHLKIGVRFQSCMMFLVSIKDDCSWPGIFFSG